MLIVLVELDEYNVEGNSTISKAFNCCPEFSWRDIMKYTLSIFVSDHVEQLHSTGQI